MRNFLLLFLSLITGCEAHSVVKGCTEGWAEFTCKYPKNNDKYETTGISGITNVQINKNDVWDKNGRFSLYHDTKSKTLRVIIKQLKKKDSGEYRCKFLKKKTASSRPVTLQLLDDNSCQRSFIQTAYKTAPTTITCDHNSNKDDSGVKFFCKDNSSVCENILSTKSFPKTKQTFSLTETNSSFNVSISTVSPQHAGLYWCGLESNEGSYRYAFRKIQLEVDDIRTFNRSLTTGQNFEYWCAYPSDALIPNKKFICKGDDPSTCHPLVTTTQHTMNAGKFSMMEKKRKNITITIRNITTGDSGTYWCGAESTDEGRSKPFFNRFLMTVIQPPITTYPVSSTQSTASAESPGGAIIITTCVSVLLLLILFGLILILIYKCHSRSRAAAQHTREEYIYEEIQEHPKKPGNAMNTIYVTADFPKNPSDLLHYSTINLQNCSDNGEALMIRASSSACEYSAVRDSQCPIYSTINQPSSEEPVYSTACKPQED